MVFDEKYQHWPEELRLPGRVVLLNRISAWEPVTGGLNRVVSGKSVTLVTSDNRMLKPESEHPLVDWLRGGVGDEGQFTALKADLSGSMAALADQDVLVLAGLKPQAIRGALDKARAEIHEWLQAGKTLMVDESVGAFLGSAVLSEGKELEPGLDLFLDSLLKLDATPSSTAESLIPRLGNPGPLVGIGVPADTVLTLSGRSMTVLGDQGATFVLPSGGSRPPRVETLQPRTGRRQAAETVVFDLTEWRRDGLDRRIGPFPAARPGLPYVPKGTLVIVGGGGMPRGLMTRLVELAGGPDQAHMVYFPCSEAEEVGERQGTVTTWRRMGVKQATFIHTKDRRKANSDEAILKPLREATGLWFGGGRQWNFSDSYYGTEAHRLMKEVLNRGGVVGGSSAGASIQGRYLARATPVGNFRIMAPGYERGGLGFLEGVAIDQHFSQRGRQRDMTSLVNRYPQLLGIGLDEATAIIVTKSTAEVVGRGRVFFYDRRQPFVEGQPDYVALPSGSSYDLVRREVLVDTRRAEGDASAGTEGGSK